MAIRPYEISLWTYNDKFVSLLTSSTSPKPSDSYSPTFSRNLSGETTLTFTIPIKYYDIETGTFINNELWYSKLKQAGTLANEKHIKLIFDKGKKNLDGTAYTHEIYEFIIEKIVETRTESELLCNVTCIGLAFKELGKRGAAITLNLETMLLEQEETEESLTPTLNYWMDRVLPAKEDDETHVAWTYQVAMGDNRLMGLPITKIYENNYVDNWEEVEGVLTPIYRIDAVEKERFIDVVNSNTYNITQDIAETFQVFVRYEYQYEDVEEPFRVTGKTVIFYDNLTEDRNYSIVYGNNAKGLEKTSESIDIITKMFVSKIATENTDSGFVAIEEAENNKLADDFILNFDYFRESGQMSSVQTNAIAPFEKALRAINIQIADDTNNVVNETYNLTISRADLKNLEDKKIARQTILQDVGAKLETFDLSAPWTSFYVYDRDVVVNVANEGADRFASLSRKGVFEDGASYLITVKYMNAVGTTVVATVPRENYVRDRYGYVVRIKLPLAFIPIAELAHITLTYQYNLLAYYRAVLQDTQSIISTTAQQITRKEEEIVQQENYLEELMDALKEAIATKKKLIRDFDNLMGFFLKEGVWSDDNYKPAFAKTIDHPFNVSLSPEPLANEPLSWEMVGEEKTYFSAIALTNAMLDRMSTIQDLEITETYSVMGEETDFHYENGAQFQVHYIVEKEVNLDAQYETVAQLTTANPSHNNAYLVLEDCRIYNYHTPSSSWTVAPIKLAAVFISDIDVSSAGHTFSYDGQTIDSGFYYKNTPYTILYPRYFLTDTGLKTGNSLPNLQNTSIEITHQGERLDEFDDYLVLRDREKKNITFKINNKVYPTYPLTLPETTRFLVDYQQDVSANSFYNDALETSKVAAFPKVTYKADFVHLGDTVLGFQEGDLNQHKRIGLGAIVSITDNDLQITGLKGIVSEINLNLDRPEENSISIENYQTKFEDLFKRMVASSAQIETNGYLYDRIASAFGADLTLDPAVLQRSFNNTELNLLVGSGVSMGPYGLLLENLAPYSSGVKGQVLLQGGGIFLSNRVESSGARIFDAAITPSGINASLVNTGRLDASLVNIYAGDQLRFLWNGEGLFAYGLDEVNSVTNFNMFVRYNHEGLLFSRDGVREVELGWQGLYLGAQDGSLELTAGEGLRMYNAPATDPNRQMLLFLGRNEQDEYGFRLYKIDEVSGEAVETLVTTNEGQLWLRDSLLIGNAQNDNFVGITGAGTPTVDYDPVRFWAGSTDLLMAPFRVTQAGKLYATGATISGHVSATSGSIGGENGWQIASARLWSGSGNSYVELNSDLNNPFALWAGAENASLAPFSVKRDGYFKATSGSIAGNFSVSGALGTPNFASGALGNGWRVDGVNGHAEFNDIFVRGSIAASVFEYEEISSIGGQLYVAPTLSFLVSSSPIINSVTPTNKYTIVIPQNFTNPLMGGRTWTTNDIVALSGFITNGADTYEIRGAHFRVTQLGAQITLTSILDRTQLLCYNNNGEDVSSSWTGFTLSRHAKAVYLGTYSNGDFLRKGILLSSAGAHTPFLDVYDDDVVAGNPKVRLGNLSGITDSYFGALSGYGLYTQDAYLTGAIYSKEGFIGGFTIGETALYNGKSSLLDHADGVYLGTEGFALGGQKFVVLPNGDFSLGDGAIAYDAEQDVLEIRADNVRIGSSSDNLSVDELLGYRLDVVATSNILSTEIASTTLVAQVWHGSQDVTATIPASRFQWKRVSNDSFGDAIWNNLNQGKKYIVLGLLDVSFSATYSCELLSA